MGILGIADLKNHLIKRFLLLTVTDMLVVVFYAAVFSCLAGVVLSKCLVKKLVIDLLNIVLHQHNIVRRSCRIDILCDELSVIVINAAFAYASADSSLDVITLLPNASALRRKN